MKILSLSSNGAANKLLAQVEFEKLLDSHLEFIRPIYNIRIRIPLIGSSPLPLVGIQDPKHARKTNVNQLLLGARLLCFGKYWFSILHLSIVVEHKDSSLYVKDVFNSDKQDNSRAYQVLSEDTLKIALENKECVRLAVYLFVMEQNIPP
ncbi:hypothetical protein PCANC_11793 [Puccinia coronata f. sp. avenae]|uniref:Uncharacterized protein n=1 Tax=Puccinia coronata f. sp. avenae TaxID=200324 RepID=A0A2N5SVB5_9BASI|nr:hypothetical protein PCANC_11793 [Puccinia coronata f. sp. avenae]